MDLNSRPDKSLMRGTSVSPVIEKLTDEMVVSLLSPRKYQDDISVNLNVTPMKTVKQKTPSSRTKLGRHIGPLPFSKYSPLKRVFESYSS